jgi:hypothetical protein
MSIERSFLMRSMRWRTAIAAVTALAGLGVSATAATASAAPSASRPGAVPADTTQPVQARVSGGGFNGNVEYSPTYAYGFIQAWGEVWSSAGTTYVYLSWIGSQKNNKMIGLAAEGQGTQGIGDHSYSTLNVPYDIEVTVCNDYPSWHCGTPYLVN